MLVAATIPLAAALAPPLVPPGGRALLMWGFSPLCHQLPGRSLFLGEVQLAVCDRCLGIYVGLVVGVATIGWGRRLWAQLRPLDRIVLLGSLVPLVLDWAGPVLGLWPNVPVSRATTGLLFGGVAASFTADRLLAGGARPENRSPRL